MLGQAHDRLSYATYVLAQLCLLVIVASYSFETISRYVFAAPTSWSNVVVGYALCIGTFLALPYVTRIGGHIAITFLSDALPPDASAALKAALAFGSAIICLFVAWICLRMNIQHFATNEMTVGVHPVPKGWISIWLTYGFASSGLHFLRHAFKRRDPITG